MNIKIKKTITLLFSIVIFILIFIFTQNINAQAKENSNSLFGESSLNCGYANTDYNACCLKSTSFDIVEEDVESIISKVKSCTLTKTTEDVQEQNLSQCFSDSESEIIMTLINTEKSDIKRFAIYTGLPAYLISTDPDKETNFEMPIPFGGTITADDMFNFFREKRIEYNNLSPSEKIKIQITNSIPTDKCLINVAGMKGFCLRGIAHFFGGLGVSNPKVESALQASEDIQINECTIGEPVRTGGECICKTDTTISGLCNPLLSQGNKEEFEACTDCTNNKFGLWTGIGCIRLSISGFIEETLFGWGIGLAGIITLICIFISAFMLQTSAGNPERVKKARQYLTACITGLLLIIFSILILRIIGVSILRIPGFI